MAKPIRIILDTNWYVSASFNKNSRQLLYNLFNNKSVVVFLSDEILNEYIKVIKRAKFRSLITDDLIERFLIVIFTKTEKIERKTNFEGSRDPKDNFLIALSIDNEVDFLVTGDKDLLILGKIGATQIITLTEFFDNHAS